MNRCQGCPTRLHGLISEITDTVPRTERHRLDPVRLRCGHVFHQQCFDNASHCPIQECGQPVSIGPVPINRSRNMDGLITWSLIGTLIAGMLYTAIKIKPVDPSSHSLFGATARSMVRWSLPTLALPIGAGLVIGIAYDWKMAAGTDQQWLNLWKGISLATSVGYLTTVAACHLLPHLAAWAYEIPQSQIWNPKALIKFPEIHWVLSTGIYPVSLGIGVGAGLALTARLWSEGDDRTRQYKISAMFSSGFVGGTIGCAFATLMAPRVWRVPYAKLNFNLSGYTYWQLVCTTIGMGIGAAASNALLIPDG